MTCFEKLSSPAQERKQCVQKIHITKTDTFSSRIMRDKRKWKGVPPDICGMRATHLHDGLPFCQSHAAQRALKVMLGELD